MTAINLGNLDPAARGLRLHRHSRSGDLIACELVIFSGGAPAINTVLRRAGLAGTVECEPFEGSMDYFADVYVDECTSTQTIHLDRNSYAALKNHWMRCRLERAS